MYQRDYILRMIEMVAQLIAAILSKIKKGEYETASEQLSNLYYDVLKEDAAYFRDIAVKDLTTKLLQDHNYTNGHLEILAELFNAEAELNIGRGDRNASVEYLEKSLILFEFIDSHTNTYSLERINRIESLKKKIESIGKII
jgi:anti-sigma28 factor (negative regulator of flagellin synthesis)